MNTTALQKTFAETAAALKWLKAAGGDKDTVNLTALELAGTYAKLDASFDKEKFLAASGLFGD